MDESSGVTDELGVDNLDTGDGGGRDMSMREASRSGDGRERGEDGEGLHRVYVKGLTELWRERESVCVCTEKRKQKTGEELGNGSRSTARHAGEVIGIISSGSKCACPSPWVRRLVAAYADCRSIITM